MREKPSSRRDDFAIDGKRTSREGAGAHGAGIGAGGGVVQAGEVTRKGLRVGHQEMGQEYGLGMLEMGSCRP